MHKIPTVSHLKSQWFLVIEDEVQLKTVKLLLQPSLHTPGAFSILFKKAIYELRPNSYAPRDAWAGMTRYRNYNIKNIQKALQDLYDTSQSFRSDISFAFTNMWRYNPEKQVYNVSISAETSGGTILGYVNKIHAKWRDHFRFMYFLDRAESWVSFTQTESKHALNVAV